MVLIVLSCASFLAYVLAMARIPQQVTGILLGLTSNRISFLLLVNLIVIVIGLFLDAVPLIVILTPVLLPAAMSLGIDPVFFGVMLTVNLMIGVITPPVGFNLFVIVSIAKIDLMRLSRAVLPFIAIYCFIILLMILFPDAVMYLPRLFR